MADLSIVFAGIKAPNPFWLASAPPTDKAYNVNRAFEAGWGGVVWKTLGMDPPVVNVSSRYGAIRLNGQRIAGLNNINPSVMEAARIDGTTAWSRFWRVTFPMLSPSLFFCSVMTVIGGFKVFAQPYVLTLGGPGNATNTLVLSLYRTGFSYDRLGLASSMAWVLFVIVMLVTALQFVGQKRWVSYDA